MLYTSAEETAQLHLIPDERLIFVVFLIQLEDDDSFMQRRTAWGPDYADRYTKLSLLIHHAFLSPHYLRNKQSRQEHFSS
mmetsp:Transcript_4201/g.6148  ORF Transcript_4201/g.6148 Transcript_4201/m.6148 type:complete len:80 (-) Transcript_4201:20-259(-)